LSIYGEITNEIARAGELKKAGKFKETVEDMVRRGGLGDAMNILTEEYLEAIRELNDSKPLVSLRKELIEVAAVAISMASGLDYLMLHQASAI
jgi:hypothetical protein